MWGWSKVGTTFSKWGNIKPAELLMCKNTFKGNEMKSNVENLLVTHFCSSINDKTGLSPQACGQQHHVVPRVVKAMKNKCSAGSSQDGGVGGSIVRKVLHGNL